MQKDKIQELFSFDPKGIWIAERIWEPRLPRILSKAGVDFTIIDDSHFKLVGKDPEQLNGFYVTEEQGDKLFIFPSSEKFRHYIPFRSAQETIDYLKSKDIQNEVAITYADDGENFGLWPGTHKWVYREKWLEDFFCRLEENGSWINFVTFGEYISAYKPTDRVYLSCASYQEMMQWSEGFYRNFLLKYPETNNMHKKMLYVSNKINKLDLEISKKRNKSDNLDFKANEIFKARQELYKSQANDAYWHGLFGGVYLNHLRSAVYKHLIEAEKIIDDSFYQDSYVKSERIDFDCDGREEIIINTKNQNLIFRPSEGGTMSYWAFKPRSLNLINTLSRRYESYHQELRTSSNNNSHSSNSVIEPQSIHSVAKVKEFKFNLGELLIYDRYPRYCLLDHFLKSRTSLSDFVSNRFNEAGNFINKFYNSEINQKKKNIEVRLSIIGEIEGCSAKLVKKIKIKDKGLLLNYKLENLQSNKKLSSIFGVEFNLSIYEPSLNEQGEIKDIKNFQIHDIWNRLKISYNFSHNINIWHFPVETVSKSESGIERTYQQLCLLIWSDLEIGPNETWTNSIEINIDSKE